MQRGYLSRLREEARALEAAATHVLATVPNTGADGDELRELEWQGPRRHFSLQKTTGDVGFRSVTTVRVDVRLDGHVGELLFYDDGEFALTINGAVTFETLRKGADALDAETGADAFQMLTRWRKELAQYVPRKPGQRTVPAARAATDADINLIRRM